MDSVAAHPNSSGWACRKEEPSSRGSSAVCCPFRQSVVSIRVVVSLAPGAVNGGTALIRATNGFHGQQNGSRPPRAVRHRAARPCRRPSPQHKPASAVCDCGDGIHPRTPKISAVAVAVSVQFSVRSVPLRVQRVFSTGFQGVSIVVASPLRAGADFKDADPLKRISRMLTP